MTPIRHSQRRSLLPAHSAPALIQTYSLRRTLAVYLAAASGLALGLCMLGPLLSASLRSLCILGPLLSAFLRNFALQPPVLVEVVRRALIPEFGCSRHRLTKRLHVTLFLKAASSLSGLLNCLVFRLFHLHFCGSLQRRIHGLLVWHLRHHCVIVGSR